MILRIGERPLCAAAHAADVSERGKFRGLFGTDVGRLHSTIAEWRHRVAQFRVRAPLFRENVHLLARVLDDVVELRPRSLDVLMASIDERPQLAPAKMNARKGRYP